MNDGQIYRIAIDEIKDGSNILTLLNIKEQEIIEIIADTSKKFIIFLTKQGMVKKTLLEEYKNIKRSGVIGINLRENDKVVSACFTDDEDLILLSANGMTIKFHSADITPTGRNTMGVLAIKLREGDCAASLSPVHKDKEYILIISKNGFAKKTISEEYSLQKRNGVGLIGCKLTADDQALAILSINEKDTILIYSNDKLIKIPCTDVPTLSRASQGNHIAKYGNVNNIHII